MRPEDRLYLKAMQRVGLHSRNSQFQKVAYSSKEVISLPCISKFNLKLLLF